ncbi:MAG: hypothetical protein U0525_02985 [Patescibacteria group bacterium]
MQQNPTVTFDQGEEQPPSYWKISLVAIVGVGLAILFFSMIWKPNFYAKLMGAKINADLASSDDLSLVAALISPTPTLAITMTPVPSITRILIPTLTVTGPVPITRPVTAAPSVYLTQGITIFPTKSNTPTQTISGPVPVTRPPTSTPAVYLTQGVTLFPSVKTPTPTFAALGTTYNLMANTTYLVNGKGSLKISSKFSTATYINYYISNVVLSGLVPGRQYQVYICSNTICSTNTATRVVANSSGAASLVGPVTIGSTYSATASRTVQIREYVAPGSPLPISPKSCTSVACMYASISGSSSM